ncbi:sulfatase [Alienimonas californiensis]|uniref:Arylsulfatase n=1 Tax=Alienimonas californiensis TaxID=2527989 RepID=A0A517P5L9_9PLAN|nr:Arylsulfatase [Alienimonas californiensis]
MVRSGRFRFAATVAVCWSAWTNAFSAEEKPRPNVVLILADDLGWQDVGCYDVDEPCPYETPNIDRLATQGTKFWQAYSPAPTCAPSRAAILSGTHPARAQKTHVVGGAPPAPHSPASPLISPWYSGRMPLSDVTIAEALKPYGYTTGHVGKWHVAINHNAFPQPEDQGFDFTRSDRGATSSQRPHRLTDFATVAEDDPYRLDEDGFPFDQNTEDALTFLRTHKAEPFFLYHATWLVHSPIHTRSEALLRKYCEKMNVPFPTEPEEWLLEGQQNPFYGAMVEMLDHYVGEVIGYLDETDDPRRPGHKLAENTYVIFTSDNGGMEKHPGEIITDNAPLDKGKINAKEGGVRVPLIVRGPGVPAGAESDAMVNGLDFYPTILEWTGAPRPVAQRLDGVSLASYLAADPADRPPLLDSDGAPRDTMVWHFPHGPMQSTIRIGGEKLVRNWGETLLPGQEGLDLFRLYDEGGNRVDLEEARDLSAERPARAAAMNAELERRLAAMNASAPYLNPDARRAGPERAKVCRPLDHGRDGNVVWATFEERGANVVRADLIYTNNGGERYEEWYRLPARLDGERAEATLPGDATHYLFNFVDENHYLVSYPAMAPEKGRSEPPSTAAFTAAAE